MWIINGRIYTMAETIYDPGFIYIQRDKIQAVGPMSDCPLTFPQHLKDKNRPDTPKPAPDIQEDVLDVHGAFVMPGIIEAHCHLGITEEKQGVIGDDSNECTNPVTPALRAIDGINPMDPAFHDALEAGITTVMTGPGSANVVGGQFVLMKTHGRCIDQMVLRSPAAMKIAFGENPKTCYGDQNLMPATRMASVALLRKELFRASQYLQTHPVASGPETDFELEPWRPVFNHEIPLKAHAHRADDLLTVLRIAREFQLNVTLDHCTEGHLIAPLLAEAGFPAIVGPDLTARSKPEVRYMSFKTPAILQKAGLLVAITTDHPVSLIQYLPLCAGLAVRHGLPLSEGLKALTINPAKICGIDHRLGSLEPGKDADIAIFTGNPMETFTRTLYTILNGEIVYAPEDSP